MVPVHREYSDANHGIETVDRMRLLLYFLMIRLLMTKIMILQRSRRAMEIVKLDIV